MSASAESTTDEARVGTKVPDFFVVGQPKSGTTAIYEMLRRHPQIYMPDIKEPMFFASDLRPNARAQASGHERRPVFPSTYEEYLSLFAPATADQRVGEASSSYLRSRVAASAIAEVQPSARIIAILREPASLLRSLHLQRLQEHVESEPDFAQAMALEETRQQGIRARPRDRPQMLLYSDFIHYVEQLRRYDAVFAREQMLVLIYDDFRRDNEGTMRGVLRFLQVDDAAPIEALRANPTVAVRSERLERMVRGAQSGRGPLSRPARTIVKAVTPQQLRRRLFYPLRRRVMYRAPERVDETVMAELRRRFKPEVVALSEYLDRDLVALWGYDSLE